MSWGAILPVAMLAAANVVVNVAWYGHLKTPDRALWLAILASWGLALVEYCLVVPAVRYGSATFSMPQLKTWQLLFSAATFLLVALILFGQRPTPAQVGGFTLMVAGAALVFRGS